MRSDHDVIRPGPGWYVYLSPHAHISAFADLHGPFDAPEQIFEWLAENDIPYSEQRTRPRIATFYSNEMRDGFIADYTPVASGIHHRD